MLELIENLLKLKADGLAFVVATIIQHGGSTPRSSGAKMIVLNDAKIIGTIGGGKLEADAIEKAVNVIKDGPSQVIDYQFSGADAAAMDMICGGNARVLLDRISPTSTSFWSMVETAAGSRLSPGGWLAMTIRPGGEVLHQFIPRGHGLEMEARTPVDLENVRVAELREKDGELLYIEPILFPTTVYLFGAGHVSRAIARLTKMVDFRTVIIDDREEFANRDRFPEADEIRVDLPVGAVLGARDLTPADFIVIVTRGHLQDQLVLEKALQTRAGYIGMIGSKRKCRLIFDSLREKGFTEEQILNVHAPIGLNIQAETPEEIAVSIVAELIQQQARIRTGR